MLFRSFTPPPEVDSAVVRFEWKPNVPQATAFTDFVHETFSSRRKTLANNLRVMSPTAGREQILERLRHAGISPGARPEELTVDDFLRVYNQFT